MTNEEIKQWYDKLSKFDWYYQYSDDHSVWKYWSDKMDAMWKDIKDNPLLLQMYNDWHDHYFSGEHMETPQKPKPKLEDYLK